MKKYLYIILLTLFFSNCATTRQYTLKNTLAIFLLNNGKNWYFCIPVQYIGEYQIDNFELTGGFILIGDYEISLKKDEVNIPVYFNDPTTKKYEPDDGINYYYIFIEKYLSNNDVKNINNEYEKGNVYSKVYIEYDITVDNELQTGNGMYDDFELSDGPAMDSTWFPENLNFFKAKYLP